MRRWQSGQLQLTVNQSPLGLRRFKSYPAHNMLDNLFLLIVSLFLIIKSSTWATKYSGELAESFHLPKYTVGFIIVAVISIFPETLIAINSALGGISSFGLGTLFGSNIADMTLVFVIIILISGKNIKVESKILKKNIAFPFVLLIPVVMGLDGFYSRLEGILLIIIGIAFYILALRSKVDDELIKNIEKKNRKKNSILLFGSVILLLIGAHFTVTSATSLSEYLNISPVIVGMFVVGLGTTIPELLFSLRAVQKDDDSLAVGDIFGTVLADATIVLGILAIVKPFHFPESIVYSAGSFMVISSIVLLYFMNSDKKLTKKEGYLLLLIWITFVIVELFINL